MMQQSDSNNNDDGNAVDDDDYDENDANDQYEENPPYHVEEVDDNKNDANVENEEKIDQYDDVISRKNCIIVSFKETKQNLTELLKGQKINEKLLKVFELKKYFRRISIPKKM